MSDPAVPPSDREIPQETAPAFESPLRLRRRVGRRVRRVRQMARPYKLEITRFSKFLVVGAIGFVVDFGIFNLLAHVANIEPWIAGIGSLICAICSNFAFNHYWVYPDAHGNVLKQFAQFFVVSVVVAVFRAPLILYTSGPFAALVEQVVRLPAAQAEVLGNNLALMVAVVIALFWNFFVNRFWTYRHAPRG
jgi:putative flippase GtrA